MRIFLTICIVFVSFSFGYSQGLDLFIIDIYRTDNTARLEQRIDWILSEHDSSRSLLLYVFNDHRPIIAKDLDEWESAKRKLSGIFPGIPEPNSLIDTLPFVLPKEVMAINAPEVHYFCSSSNALLRNHVQNLLEKVLLLLMLDLSVGQSGVFVYLNRDDPDFSFESYEKLKEKYSYNFELY